MEDKKSQNQCQRNKALCDNLYSTNLPNELSVDCISLQENQNNSTVNKNISINTSLIMFQQKSGNSDSMEGEKCSDDDEISKEKSDKDEKKDEEESISSSSFSSDVDSESSSDDKTETSNPEPIKSNSTSADAKNEIKNEDNTDDSDIEDDLVSAINYNTITSLAALKDMLQSSGEDSEGVDSFFHHYFLSHVNRLPSRNQTHSPYPWGRRLSECREEDEYETEEGKKQSERARASVCMCVFTVVIFIYILISYSL